MKTKNKYFAILFPSTFNSWTDENKKWAPNRPSVQPKAECTRKYMKANNLTTVATNLLKPVNWWHWISWCFAFQCDGAALSCWYFAILWHRSQCWRHFTQLNKRHYIIILLYKLYVWKCYSRTYYGHNSNEYYSYLFLHTRKEIKFNRGETKI